MKKLFPGYFQLTQDDFTRIWKECVFVFDTNVLLDFYRYSPETRNEFIKTINNFSARCWLPYQVAKEFSEKRLIIIYSQIVNCDSAITYLENLSDTIEEGIKKCFERLVPIELEKQSIKEIKKVVSLPLRQLKKTKIVYQGLLENDVILSQILTIFKNRVGPSFSDEQLIELTKEEKRRQDLRIPPGFRDKGNGDFILWQQTIEYAKEMKKPILLITNDAKEDWWWKIEGKTIGPRPELRNEMMQAAEVDFYMYNSERFIQFSQEHLKISIKQEAIDEVIEKTKIERMLQEQEEKDILKRLLRRNRNISEEQLRRMRELGVIDDKFLRMLSSSEEQLRRMRELRAVDDEILRRHSPSEEQLRRMRELRAVDDKFLRMHSSSEEQLNRMRELGAVDDKFLRMHSSSEEQLRRMRELGAVDDELLRRLNLSEEQLSKMRELGAVDDELLRKRRFYEDRRRSIRKLGIDDEQLPNSHEEGESDLEQGDLE